MQHILQKDPTKRLTIEQILAHPLFSQSQTPQASASPSTSSSPFNPSAQPTTPPTYSSAHPRFSYEPSGSVTSESTSTSTSTSSELDRSSATTPDHDDDDELSHESLATSLSSKSALSDQQRVHRNASQSTIKKTEVKIPEKSRDVEKGKSKAKGKGKEKEKEKGRGKTRMTVPPHPETVVEEDARARHSAPPRTSLTRPRPRSPSGGSYKEPPALPTRTPVRTKRRSVSSTLSDPDSPITAGIDASASTHAHIHAPQDFATLLRAPAPIIFGTALERALLNNLSALGLDTAQIVHSVLSDACDATGALWWMLKRKAERRAREDGTAGVAALSLIEENDDSMEVDMDDPQARGSVEMKRWREKGRDPGKEKERGHTGSQRGSKPELSTARSAPELAFIPPTPTVTQQRPVTPPRPRSPNNPFLSPAPSVTESMLKSTTSTPAASLKDKDKDKDKDGSKGRREGKARSGSVSIMQRATTALEAAGLVRKKSSEAVKDQQAKEREREKEKDVEKRVAASEERRDSYGKIPKSPPMKAIKDSVLPTTPSMDLASAPVNPSSPWVLPGLSSSPPGSRTATPVTSPGDTLTALPNITENGVKSSGHHRNRASLLSAFRMWFNEDRKAKRKSAAGGAHGLSYGHAVGGRSPSTDLSNRGTIKVKRRTSNNARKGHPAKGHSISSRRSSSVNSRRSSTASMHMVVLDSPQYLEHAIGVSMSRQRSDPSRRSLGSRTPNSERGEYASASASRPSSVQSFSVQPRHRKSPSASSAGSIHLVRTASPFHRRAGSGSGSSTRVVRSPPPLRAPYAHTRSGSTTSSVPSLPSSRPGSFYEPSEPDGTRTASPLRTHSRRSNDDSYHPIPPLQQQQPRRATFVAQKRPSALGNYYGYGVRSGSSWKKSWGMEPPGWQTRTAHVPVDVQVLSVSPSLVGPVGDGAGGLRDVFSGRQSLSMGDEDDWVDEEDDVPAFAGGLGQMSASVSTSAPGSASTSPIEYGGYSHMEAPIVLGPAPRGNVGRAATKRAGKAGGAGGVGGAPSAGGTGAARSKSVHSPIGRISPLPADVIVEPPEARGGRRQLPNNRPGPAFRGNAIQEEDEGEEE